LLEFHWYFWWLNLVALDDTLDRILNYWVIHSWVYIWLCLQLTCFIHCSFYFIFYSFLSGKCMLANWWILLWYFACLYQLYHHRVVLIYKKCFHSCQNTTSFWLHKRVLFFSTLFNHFFLFYQWFELDHLLFQSSLHAVSTLLLCQTCFILLLLSPLF